MFIAHRSPVTFAAALLTTVLGFSSFASADIYDHMDRVALRIQKKSQRLVKEVNHYRHTAQYRHLLHDAQALCDLAAHVHEVTHYEGNLRHLESDLAKLDRTFHHIEGVFDHVEHEARYGHGGHIHGNTKHVKNLLNQIEREIHHLRDDVQKLRSQHRGHASSHGHARVQTYRVPSNYGYGSHGLNSRSNYNYGQQHRGHYNQYRTARGFSIGGGSSRIWIGF